jgi:hypothetical protein
MARGIQAWCLGLIDPDHQIQFGKGYLALFGRGSRSGHPLPLFLACHYDLHSAYNVASLFNFLGFFIPQDE